MTPTEKSKEILEKFKYPSEQSRGNIWAKQCAIICVEQIIGEHYDYGFEARKDYWEDVLNHLKNS